ncbi:MAG: 30S ribosomal protein S21 [Nitrospirota bacterium]
MQITVHGNNVEKALKDLKRQLQKEGLLKELKKRSFYLKPSEKEKQKQREAKRKRLRAQRLKSARSANRRPS